MSSQWYEAVTTASTTFGNYVEDILGTKLARALPIVILLPSDKVKLSLLSWKHFHVISGTVQNVTTLPS